MFYLFNFNFNLFIDYNVIDPLTHKPLYFPYLNFQIHPC